MISSSSNVSYVRWRESVVTAACLSASKTVHLTFSLSLERCPPTAVEINREMSVRKSTDFKIKVC